MIYEDEVEGNSDYDAFDFKIEEYEDNDSNYEVGEIIDQDPTEGTQVASGSTITLTVAVEATDDAETTVKVPSVVGKSYEDAQSALRARGLSASRKEQSSDTIQEGYVIETDPEAGEEVATGSTVTVYVSSGPADTNKTVPDLTGMTQSAAKSLLESYGLTLGTVTQEESSSATGTVIDQTIPSGTSVAEGTAVGITIATAVQDTSDDNNDDNDTDTDTDTDGDTTSGSASVSVTSSNVTVTLPTDRDTCNVTVSVDGSQLYNHTVRTSNGTAVCKVAYSGTRRVVVTLDGETIYDQDYDFG